MTGNSASDSSPQIALRRQPASRRDNPVEKSNAISQRMRRGWPAPAETSRRRYDVSTARPADSSIVSAHNRCRTCAPSGSRFRDQTSESFDGEVACAERQPINEFRCHLCEARIRLSKSKKTCAKEGAPKRSPAGTNWTKLFTYDACESTLLKLSKNALLVVTIVCNRGE